LLYKNKSPFVTVTTSASFIRGLVATKKHQIGLSILSLFPTTSASFIRGLVATKKHQIGLSILSLFPTTSTSFIRGLVVRKKPTNRSLYSLPFPPPS
jgi:hypothetical protein